MAYFKETKSATMNIFRKIFFSKNGVCKSRIKSCFLNKTVSLNIFYSINTNDIQHTYIVNIQRIRTKA